MAFIVLHKFRLLYNTKPPPFPQPEVLEEAEVAGLKNYQSGAAVGDLNFSRFQIEQGLLPFSENCAPGQGPRALA